MELITTNAVQRWRETLGPTDAELARREAPDTIRAKFGKDKQSNAAHGSDSDVAATRVGLTGCVFLCHLLPFSVFLFQLFFLMYSYFFLLIYNSLKNCINLLIIAFVLFPPPSNPKKKEKKCSKDFCVLGLPFYSFITGYSLNISSKLLNSIRYIKGQ